MQEDNRDFLVFCAGVEERGLAHLDVFLLIDADEIATFAEYSVALTEAVVSFYAVFPAVEYSTLAELKILKYLTPALDAFYGEHGYLWNRDLAREFY